MRASHYFLVNLFFRLVIVALYDYIYIYIYGNDIEICGWRARPRGPGGSIKYQFVYLNVMLPWTPYV